MKNLKPSLIFYFKKKPKSRLKFIRESSQSYTLEFLEDCEPYKKGDQICDAKYEFGLVHNDKNL